VKLRATAIALLCLAGSWYYALSIAARGGFAMKPGIINDYYPLWNASRCILHRIDPYSPEVTEQNDIAANGVTAKVLGTPIRQRFAYPAYATFPVLPLGLFDSGTAKQVALWLFAALVALSVGWLRAKWDGRTVLYTILALASYPVIIALQMRQPTILFFGLAVGSFALFRSGYLIPAGIVAAFAVGKPQIAAVLLLPMLISTVARWQNRKAFVTAFAFSLLALLLLASFVAPGWFPEWLEALRGYSQSARPSAIAFMFGHKVSVVISVGLLLGLATLLWRHRKRDLLFQAAISAPVFYLITPFVDYNAILLLVPAVWIADNCHSIQEGGTANQLALAAVRVAFIGLWLAAPLGALLLHMGPLANRMAWGLPELLVSPLLCCITVLMVTQSLSASPGARQPATVEIPPL